jgi:hypothetical protein
MPYGALWGRMQVAGPIWNNFNAGPRHVTFQSHEYSQSGHHVGGHEGTSCDASHKKVVSQPGVVPSLPLT